MNNQIFSYIRALQYFQKNPFEESFCGLSRQDALTLVQNYLDQHIPDRKINLLRHADLLSSGKNISAASLSFGNQIINALDYLSTVQNLPKDQTQINFTNSIVPTAEINNIIGGWQNEVIDKYEDHLPTGRRDFLRASSLRGGVLKKDRWEDKEIAKDQRAGDFIKRELLKTRSLKVYLELEEERRERREKNTDEIAKELKRNPLVVNSPFAGKLQTIIVRAIEETEGEDEIWEDASVSIDRPLERKSIGKISPLEREEKIQEIYEKKIKEAITNDDELKNSIQDDQVKQIFGSLPANLLAQRSYYKFADKIIPKYDQTKSFDEQIPDPLKKRGEVGRLLFGKIVLEAERATSGVKLNQKQKQKMGDAVAEAFFELQSKGLNLANMSEDEINRVIYDKLDQKLRTTVLRSPVDKFDISQEARLNAVFEGQYAATHGNTEELHTLPIPGLIFLDKLARTEIVANDQIFEMLKLKKVDEILDNKNIYLRLYSTVLPEKYHEAQKEAIEKTGDPNNIQVKFSKEEELLLKKYLQSYQQVIQKHNFIGRLAHWNARLYSMQQNARLPIIGTIPIPKAMAWGYTRYFLQMSFADPTIMPLAGVMLSWSFAKGMIGLHFKNQYYVKTIDRVGNFLGKTLGFSKVPIFKELRHLKNLFYVKEHGIAIVSWLHPIHAGKAFLQESGKKLLEKLGQKSVMWGTRILGKPAMDKILAKLAASALGKLVAGGAIPVIGQILAVFGFLWDFIFPEWLKRLIKLVIGGIILGIAWLIGIIVGIVGPLAAIGFFAGLIVGGPLVALTWGAVGFVGQSILWILTGNVMWLPAWLHGIANGIGSFFTGLWNGLTAAGKAAAPGALMGPMVSSGAWMAVASVGTAAAGGLVSVMMITTAVWTPIAPSAVPGGLIASDFQVRKYVVSDPENACQTKQVCETPTECHTVTTACQNDIAEVGNSTSFKYTIEIQAQSGKVISNIQIEDNITVLAQGPTIVNPPKVDTYTITPPDLQTQVDGKIIDGNTPNNTLKLEYTISDLHDPKYQNSIVANLVKVTANGQTATNGTTFTIGTPPKTCPVLAGRITCASLGSTRAESCHGTDRYWRDFAYAPYCRYQLPVLDQTSFRGNADVADFTTAFCKAASPGEGTAHYGFALDISSSGNDTVYFPWIIGEDAVSWKILPGFPTHMDGETYYQAKYVGTGDKTYFIYVTHLTQNDYVSQGMSGEPLGKICNDCNMKGPHLHIELGILQGGNTEYVRPEDYFLCL